MYIHTYTYTYVPDADVSLAVTCTVILVDDGLLRISTGCAGPLPSATSYVDCAKLIVTAKQKGIIKYQLWLTIKNSSHYIH